LGEGKTVRKGKYGRRGGGFPLLPLRLVERGKGNCGIVSFSPFDRSGTGGLHDRRKKGEGHGQDGSIILFLQSSGERGGKDWGLNLAGFVIKGGKDREKGQKGGRGRGGSPRSSRKKGKKKSGSTPRCRRRRGTPHKKGGGRKGKYRD